jgi:hypothetical protein
MTQNPSKELKDWYATSSSRVANDGDLSGADKIKSCNQVPKMHLNYNSVCRDTFRADTSCARIVAWGGCSLRAHRGTEDRR